MTAQWDREVDVLSSRIGDPGVKPNPNLGPLEKGPFTASVMGHTNPGPGSTIAPAMVFGYLAALHAAATSVSVTPSETVIPKEKEPLA